MKPAFFRQSCFALGLLAVASAATAGTFDGPFVQAGVGFAAAQTDAQSHWTLPPNIDAQVSQTRFIGQLAVGYSRAFGRYNLAASAFGNVGDQSSGRVSLDDGIAGANTYTFEQKNSWGIGIEPGIHLSPSTLAYLKLGYARTTGRTLEVFRGTPWRYDAKYEGWMLGVGFKHRLSEHLYGFGELVRTDYRSARFTETDGSSFRVKPAALTGIVGVGYRF